MEVIKQVFESSVNSYDSQTRTMYIAREPEFESSVNSYDSQTLSGTCIVPLQFESSVNSYDSQTMTNGTTTSHSLRVV